MCYGFGVKNKKWYILDQFWFKHVPYPHLIFFLSKILQIYIKLCGKYEFEKKIKKTETLFLDREDFTDNDT